MKYTATVLFFFIVSIGCTNKETQHEQKISGEIIEIHNPKKLSIDDIILEYDTIRLEVTEDSYIAEITKMEILDNKMYIWDYKQNMIFIFSSNGKFISKINDRGEGPNQYIAINGFEADFKNNKIILSDTFSIRIFVYNKEGKQEKVIKFEGTPLKIAQQNDYFINVYTGIKNIYDNPDIENKMVHFFDSCGQYKYGLLDKPQGNTIAMAPLRNICCLKNGDVLFQPLLDYSIYKISDGKCNIAYTLENKADFKLLNNKQKDNISLIVGKENSLAEIEKKGYLLFLGDILDTENYILLYPGYNKQFIIVYHKTKKESVTIFPEKLEGDEIQKLMLSVRPNTADKDIFYIALDYLFVDKAIDKVKNNKLKEFFKNTKEMDNPCIITYKIRDL